MVGLNVHKLCGSMLLNAIIVHVCILISECTYLELIESIKSTELPQEYKEQTMLASQVP